MSLPEDNTGSVLDLSTLPDQNAKADDTAKHTVDLSEGTDAHDELDLSDAQPEFDAHYVDPVIAQVLEPFDDIVELLHIAHGDQLNIAKLIEGINKGAADSPETELFREMVRIKGAESAMRWLASTQAAINHMAYNNGLTDTVMTTDSQWLQGLLIDNAVVGTHRPDVVDRKNPHVKGQRLTGKEAMIRVRQELRIGDYVTLPLPHTGIWVTLLVAGEDEMVNFHTRVLNAKSVLGRRTAGLIFSNSDVVILRHLWDLLAGMIVNTSMGHANKKELSSLIKIQDIPLMVAGYMSARFRSGYTIAQPCQVDPTKCNDISVQKVSIARMTIIDNSRLSDAQRAHMRNRNGHRSESVLAYQEAFVALNDGIAMLTDTTRVVFGVPGVDQKLVAGDAWIDAIEDAVTLSFNDTMTRDERVNYINKQAGVAALRNYAHWVKRIDYLDSNGDVYGFIEGNEDIYAQLTELSKDDVIRTAFYKAVNEHINKLTIGIVALPRYTCPSCKSRQPMVNNYFPSFHQQP